MVKGVPRAAGRFVRAAGKVALWTGAAAAGVVIFAMAAAAAEKEDARKAEEEEAKKPPIIAKFDGHDDTYTAPFSTSGPWQIAWEGELDIVVRERTRNNQSVIYDNVGGIGGSAFFPSAGAFYLVIRCAYPGWWSLVVRCRE